MPMPSVGIASQSRRNGRMRVVQETPDDDAIENDHILVGSTRKRIITGSDLLGRLLRGIATVGPVQRPVPEARRA